MNKAVRMQQTSGLPFPHPYNESGLFTCLGDAARCTTASIHGVGMLTEAGVPLCVTYCFHWSREVNSIPDRNLFILVW